MSIDRRIAGSIADSASIPAAEIKPGDNLFEDLGLDSLDMVAIAIDLEREFDIVITDEELEMCVTPLDFERLVASKEPRP